MVCTDGTTIGMCQYVLLAATGVLFIIDLLIIVCGVALCRYCIITDACISLLGIVLYLDILLLIILQDVVSV